MFWPLMKDCITQKDKDELFGKDYKTVGDHPIDTKPDIKLFDKFDWAAIGIAACGIVFFIHLLWGI